jgi:hypothetical protein
MAVFVDLGEEENEPPQRGQPLLNGQAENGSGNDNKARSTSIGSDIGNRREEAHELAVKEIPNRNSMTQALGCYP